MAYWNAEDVLKHIQAQVDAIIDEAKYTDTHTAFVDWALRKMMNLAPVDANQACTYSMPGDGGMDAFYVDTTKKQLYVVQGKTSAPLSKISTFGSEAIKDLQEVLNKFHDLKNTSGMFRNAAIEYHKRFKEGYNVSFVALVSGNPAPSMIRAQEAFVEVFNSDRTKYRGHHCKIISLIDINAKINEMLSQDTVKSEIVSYGTVSPQKGYHHKDGRPEALVLDLPAIEIGKLVQKHEYAIIQKNLRYPLTSEFNDSILGTLNNPGDRHMFWYYNNGITVVCEKIHHLNQGEELKLQLVKPQIVNGGQTAFTIKRYIEENKNHEKDLEGVKVLVRIISVGDGNVDEGRAMAARIAKFTNSQNAIDNRDLRSNDEVQIILQDKFKTLKWFYERKAAEWRSVRGQARTKAGFSGMVNNESVAQLALGFWLGKPQEAKNEKREIFREGASGHYRAIFNPDRPGEISAEDLLLPHVVNQLLKGWINSWKKKNKVTQKNSKSTALLRRWEIIKNADQYLLAITGEVLRESCGTRYFSGEDDAARHVNARIIASLQHAITQSGKGATTSLSRALNSLWQATLLRIDDYCRNILKTTPDTSARKILIKKGTYIDPLFKKKVTDEVIPSCAKRMRKVCQAD